MMRLGLALSFASLCGPLMAQEEPVPSGCRPLFTTSAGVAAPGELELELGAQRISNRDGSEDSLFPVQFNLGVSRWFDLRFGWSGPMLRKDGQGRAAAAGPGPPGAAPLTVARPEVADWVTFSSLQYLVGGTGRV